MKSLIILTFGLGLILSGAVAKADMAQIKAYKDAYPGARPKCISCHVDKMPKKENGQHDLNSYGKAIIKAAGTTIPTADTYKKVGPIPPQTN